MTERAEDTNYYEAHALSRRIGEADILAETSSLSTWQVGEAGAMCTVQYPSKHQTIP